MKVESQTLGGDNTIEKARLVHGSGLIVAPYGTCLRPLMHAVARAVHGFI